MKRFAVALFLVSMLLGAGLFLWTRPPRDLAQELASEDPEVVVAAARQIWLDSVNGIEHGPELAAALGHESPRVRARCLKTLWRLNLNSHADAVVPLLRDPVERVRIQAAVALRDLRGYRDSAPLIETFRDRAQLDRVRVDVAYSLAERGERSAVEHFVQVAGDPEEPVRVRMEAVRGLATMRLREHAPLLMGLVRDEAQHLRLRRTAMESLGRLPTPQTRAFALQALADETLPVRLRAEAAGTLGCQGDPSAVPALQAFLAPPHELLVRVRAAQALTELEAPPADVLPLVREGLASEDPAVRSETACLAVHSPQADLLEVVKAAAAREGDSKVKCDLDQAVCRLEGAAEVDPDAALAP